MIAHFGAHPVDEDEAVPRFEPVFARVAAELSSSGR